MTVYRDGSEFNQRFEKGVSKGELETKKQTGKPFKKGTTICFNPTKRFFLEEMNLNMLFFRQD